MTNKDSNPKLRSKNLLALIILYLLLPLAIIVSLLGVVIIDKYNFLCWNGADIDRYPSGKKMLESSYRGGLLHGVQIEYYPSGLMMYEKHYSKGQLHGLLRGWDAEGKIVEETGYAQGNKHGVSVCYDVSGNLSSEDSYVNGKRIKTIQYVRDPNQDRTVSFEGYYKNGKPDSGQFVRYSAAQSGFRVYTYEKGKFVIPEQTPPEDMDQ
jgi:antitoxin component YwqK of YwqJK toxin-antitoxin module